MEYLSLEQSALKVLNLTRKMLTRARQADWQNVASLEAERQSNMDSLFRHPSLPGAMIEISDILQQVLELDRESLELGAEAKTGLVQALNQQSQGTRALQAYTSNI